MWWNIVHYCLLLAKDIQQRSNCGNHPLCLVVGIFLVYLAECGWEGDEEFSVMQGREKSGGSFKGGGWVRGFIVITANC